MADPLAQSSGKPVPAPGLTVAMTLAKRPRSPDGADDEDLGAPSPGMERLITSLRAISGSGRAAEWW
jgi:hypothetical protein